MLWGYVSNGIMGIITVVTICFALPDLDSALADETGYPFIYAFMSAMNTAGTVVLSSGLLLLIFASNVSYLAGASRETFAFARDNGKPSSNIIVTCVDRLDI
jgi:choline transport protein